MAALVQGAWKCPSVELPPAPASNISQLHPGHVRIAMAMGDSITAAFAARASLFEGRDLSWAIGSGAPDQITLPWLLSFYSNTTSQPLAGSSTKAVFPAGITHLPHGDYHPVGGLA